LLKKKKEKKERKKNEKKNEQQREGDKEAHIAEVNHVLEGLAPLFWVLLHDNDIGHPEGHLVGMFNKGPHVGRPEASVLLVPCLINKLVKLFTPQQQKFNK